MLNLIKNIIANILINLPTTALGNIIRYKFYSKYLKSIGKNVVIENGVLFGAPTLIEIGDNCIFGRNVNINAGHCNGVYIGNYVAIADGTYLRSGNHKFDQIDVAIQLQGHFSSKIDFNNRIYSVVIEDNVWIGARAIILSGAHIGEGSVIAAGSVISSKIPPFSIVVGNPGRVVSNRKLKQK
jgi:maltose O-acetyltransferase